MLDPRFVEEAYRVFDDYHRLIFQMRHLCDIGIIPPAKYQQIEQEAGYHVLFLKWAMKEVDVRDMMAVDDAVESCWRL